MKNKSSYHYVGTPDPMSEKEVYSCKMYVKKNRQRMIQAGRYLVDVPALLALFHLDCWNCRAVHRETCCEGGQPYAVEESQIPLLEKEVPAIASRLQAADERENWERYGVWAQGQLPGTIRMRHGNCLFYQENNGRFGCAIHAYAEETGQDVLPLKPFSCQLYPLDLIDTGQEVLLTAVTEATSSFSRWGTDYLEQFYCANRERRKLAAHIDENWFALDGYRPAYEWNVPLLRYCLQDEAENVLRHLRESSQRTSARMELEQRMPL